MLILVYDKDLLYRNGFELILHECYKKLTSAEMSISNIYSEEIISKAELIIFPVAAGEQFICKPELLSRPRGALIGITEDELSLGAGITSCLNGITCISRRSSLAFVKRTLLKILMGILSDDNMIHERNCYFCKKRSITTRQSFIVHRLMNGVSIEKISQELNINSKSVYAHKYNIMSKFKLGSDHDLFLFSRFILCHAQDIAITGSPKELI